MSLSSTTCNILSISTGRLIVFKCRDDELETYDRQILGYTRESCDGRGIED